MKKRGQRVEEHKEHKLKEKGIIISPENIIEALDKFAAILPDTGPEELTIVKSKIASQRENLQKEIEKGKGKETEKRRLDWQIECIEKIINKLKTQGVQDLETIMRPSKPSRKDIQEMEAMITRKEKELAEKQEELQILKSPSFKPLQPTEMVDALIYSHYYPDSLDEVLRKPESLTAQSSAKELIDTANNLISISSIEPLKSKINSRKDFLKTTKAKLPLLTKLPNKPGDENNILHIISSFKENFKGISIYDNKLYERLIDILSDSLMLLITLRGQLKLWQNPDKYISLITDDTLKTKISEQIKNAKLIDCLFSWLGGGNLTKLAELIKKVNSLTEDYSLLYNALVMKSSENTFMLQLKGHREFLQNQIDFHYNFFKEFRGESSTTLAVGKNYYGDLSQIIITSCFDTEGSTGEKPALSRTLSVYSKEYSLASIILEYLGIIPSFFGGVKYYQKQIEYTRIAITWLSFSKSNLPDEIIGIDQSKVSGLLDYANPFSSISDYLKNEDVINIVLEYAGLKHKFDYLHQSEKHEFNQKLSFFLEIEKKLKIVGKFIQKEEIGKPYFKYLLETLDLIQIDLDYSKFLEIYSRPKSDLDFIKEIIGLVIYM